MNTKSKLDIWIQWNRAYIDFKDSDKESGDELVAQYLHIDVKEYQKMLCQFGAWNKPHGAPSTFFLVMRDVEKALEWVRSIEMANIMAG